jgi:hypothetical protein
MFLLQANTSTTTALFLGTIGMLVLPSGLWSLLSCTSEESTLPAETSAIGNRPAKNDAECFN